MQDLLINAVDVDYIGLQKVALVPIEGRRRNRNAIADSNTPMTVNAHSQRHSENSFSKSQGRRLSSRGGADLREYLAEAQPDRFLCAFNPSGDFGLG
jgi:hypothetical protein